MHLRDQSRVCILGDAGGGGHKGVEDIELGILRGRILTSTQQQLQVHCR